jgi:hypothetical protein
MANLYLINGKFLEELGFEKEGKYYYCKRIKEVGLTLSIQIQGGITFIRDNFNKTVQLGEFRTQEKFLVLFYALMINERDVSEGNPVELKNGKLSIPHVSGHVPEDIQTFLHRLRLAEHPEIRKEAIALFERHCR